MALPKNSLTFRGIRKPWLVAGSTDRRKPIFAPITRNIETVPGRPGGHYNSRRTQRGPLIIEQPVTILADDDLDALAKIEELAEWLYTEEPAQLEFDSEPGRVYYALLDGSTDLDQIGRFRRGTITFICPDPHRYAHESIVDVFGSQSAIVRGNTKTYPVTTVKLSGPTTFVAIGDGNDVNMVGTPMEVEQEPYVREERVFWDQMATTTGWGATTTSDDGPIVGSVGVSGGAFVPTDFSTGGSWHGPGLKKTIGGSLQDFRIDAMMKLFGAKKRVGAVHVLLLDAENNIVAKLNVLKNSLYDDGVWVRVRIGNRTEGRNVFSGQGDKNWRWMYFDGRVSLERVGDIWTMSAMRYTSERGWHAGVSRQIRDRDAYATAPVTQVQVNFWQHSTKPTPAEMSVSDIQIYKINEQPGAIPYIGDEGDEFVFDHQAGTILKNGVDIAHRKAFIGNYFPLHPGVNRVAVEPEDDIERADVRWRDRWL